MLAGRLGQGLQRVHQIDQQRETALALQHAILGPAQLPAGFAVRYQPATRPLQVGGDWYDVVDLDDGRIALIVGDCVGHGLAAATVMGQLRSACRALLLRTPSPAPALTALDRFAARLPGARCTTVFCGVLDPDTGELVYSSAGHPPPILVHGRPHHDLLDGAAPHRSALSSDRSRPEARATHAAAVDPAALHRRPGRASSRAAGRTGSRRAADLVQDNRDTALEDLADEIMSRLAPSGGYQDDVALLLYRQPAPLEVEFPPTRASSRRPAPRCAAGSPARAWTPEQTLDVLIAAGEACANAIEHGHRHQPEARSGCARPHWPTGCT